MNKTEMNEYIKAVADEIFNKHDDLNYKELETIKVNLITRCKSGEYDSKTLEKLTKYIMEDLIWK